MSFPRTQSAVALALIATLAAGGLSACSSKAEKAHDVMLDQASDFRESLKKIPPQLDDVNKRMFKAAEGQNPNRAQDVREFSKSLESLRAQARVVASEANKAEIDANKYFTAWAKDAKRADAADRPAIRADAKASKEQVNIALRYLDTARDDFRELLGTLDGIETKLKADQSESAIQALLPNVGRAQVKTNDLRNYIDRLNESIDAALAAKQ